MTGNGTSKVHSNTKLTIEGKEVGIELFRHTSKALALTGDTLGKAPKQLGNIDELIDWAVIFVARHKAAAEKPTQKKGNGLNKGGNGHATEDILRIVHEGAGDDGNRSDAFHSCVGHLYRIWGSLDRIREEMERHPAGIADKFIDQGRLVKEIARSAKAFRPELTAHIEAWEEGKPKRTKAPRKTKEAPAEPAQELEEAEESEGIEPVLHAHNSEEIRPPKQWLSKGLVPQRGHGLLSGQSGIGKTFVALDMAMMFATGQPFVGYPTKRQCGTLWFAYEGSGDVNDRLDAVIRHKCGGVVAPIRWCSDQWGEETAPFLLNTDAETDLLRACRKADRELQQEHGLPLGFIVFDTMTASAGYPPGCGENDTGATSIVMSVLRRLAQKMDAFVLGIDHMGKNPDGGTRGNSAKEASADLVLGLYADKDGSNTRMVIRKNRGGRQWLRYNFTLQEVTSPKLDEDNEPVVSAIVHWGQTLSANAGTVQAPKDPWEASCKREDQQARQLRLRDALEEVLTEHGVKRPIPPDGTLVNTVDLELVQQEFYSRMHDTDSDRRRKQFSRALEHAQKWRLIGIRDDIEGVKGTPHVWEIQPRA